MLEATDDASQIEQQLKGEKMSFSANVTPELHYGVNNDAMISGAGAPDTLKSLNPAFWKNSRKQQEE